MKNKAALSLQKFQGVSLLVLAATLLVYILLNLTASVLCEKFPLAWDLTDNQAFSLSQETVEYLSQIQQPLSITVLTNPDRLEKSGSYYSQVKNILEQYVRYGNHISLSYVDPTVNPGILTQYPQLELSADDVIVTCGEKSVKTDLLSFFNLGYDQYTGVQYILSSKAEQEITTAIMRATAAEEPKLLLLTGQEETYSSQLIQLLERNGYQAETQNLVTDTLDTSARAAFLLAPQWDLDAEQIKKLDEFLRNGEQYDRFLFYAPLPTAVTPQLDQYLSQWGIAVGDGIVLETDPQCYLGNSPYLCLADYVSEDYRSNLSNSNGVLSPFGREMSVLFDHQGACETAVLLEYSPQSCVIPTDAPADWQPSSAQLQSHPALIRSSYTKYEGTLPLTSGILAYSASGFFDAASLQSNSVANQQYLVSTLAEVTDKTDPLWLEPKELSSGRFNISRAAFLRLSGGLILVLPGCILLAGILVWLRRKNR